MKVEKYTLEQALRNLEHSLGGAYQRMGGEKTILFALLGIKHKQYRRYKKTGVLKVNEISAMRIKMSAIPNNSPYAAALRQIIKIRHGHDGK